METTYIPAGGGGGGGKSALSRENEGDSTLCNDSTVSWRDNSLKFLLKVLPNIFLKNCSLAQDKKSVMYNSFLLLLHK